jgi:hypothetical protein
MSRWRVIFGCLAITLVCVPLPTSAQVLVDSPRYTATIREALAEFEDGHFPEARALFQRAHELQPSARTLRGLGISAFELREYEDATVRLEEALASTVKPLDGKLRSDTESLLHRTYGFVGRYVLGLEPHFAQLLVDGAETDVRAGQRLLLSIGRHQLEARAPAYESDRRTLDVTGGENVGLSFTLTQIPVAPIVTVPLAPTALQVVQAAPAAAPARADEPRRPLYKNPWLWTGVVVVVAAIVIGASVAATRDRTSIAGVSKTENTPGNGIIWVP